MGRVFKNVAALQPLAFRVCLFVASSATLVKFHILKKKNLQQTNKCMAQLKVMSYLGAFLFLLCFEHLSMFF